jgi:hypothetical protein
MAHLNPIAAALLVTDTLDGLGVPYMLGGSMASAVHGVVRTTLDADIIADLRPEHAAPFVQALEDEFYVDEGLIHTAIQWRMSFRLLHQATMFKVDVFLPKRRPFDEEQFGRRIRAQILPEPEHAVWITSAEDIILAKLEWYRMGNEVSERQWRDVLGVIKTQADRLDLTYLRQWATALQVEDLLERALKEG